MRSALGVTIRRTRCLAANPALWLALSLAVSRPLGAQLITFVPRTQPELRVEGVAARHTAALAMAGANIPLGFYVRAGASLGAGTAWMPDGARLATRADLTVRFLLDPFFENTWGPYAGGGLTVRRDGSDRAAAGVLFVLGVEGRRGRSWTPSVEAGLGEGARLAVVLRKTRRNGR